MNHIKVRFRCNLDDVMNQEIWPEYLPSVPAVGDVIQSARKYKDRVVQLKVCRVTWEPVKHESASSGFEWIPVIELHLMPYWTITKWEKWYNDLIPA